MDTTTNTDSGGENTATDEFPTIWRDPGYVATIVSVLVTCALVFYSEPTGISPTPTESGLVFRDPPSGRLVYEAANRWL